MISVEPGAIVGLRNFETILVIVRKRAAIAVEVIEDTEFHFLSAPSLAPHRLRRQPILIICAREATAKIGAPLWRGAERGLLLILESPLQDALGSTF